MTEFSRKTALYDRHVALGSDMSSAWNDMAIPQNYATDPYLETTVTRSKAGLIEVTALNLLLVKGPGATDCLNYMLTSDVTKAAPGDSHISNIVNAQGGLIDDVLIYCLEPNVYRVSHGSGATATTLKELAGKYDVSVEPDDTHVLSLQGPVSLEVLSPHTPMDLAGLGYFKHAPTKLFGKDVRLARGGYSGERGYEVFCSREDAGFLWDAILEAGQGQRRDARVVDVPRHRACGRRSPVLPVRHAAREYNTLGGEGRLDGRSRQAGLCREGGSLGEQGQGALCHHGA